MDIEQDPEVCISPKVIEKARTYYETRHTWVVMKIFYTATCVAALFSLPVVDKDRREAVAGLSAMAGLTALGIHRREENKKHTIETGLRQSYSNATMSWQEKCDFFEAQKAQEKKEKNGLKIMGAGMACALCGQPILGGTLVIAGLLHNTTSRDFLKVQDRILDNHEYQLLRQQMEQKQLK